MSLRARQKRDRTLYLTDVSARDTDNRSLKHLVLHWRPDAELVRHVVEPSRRERDDDLAVRGVLPVPTVNAWKRRGQRAGGLARVRLLLIGLRVSTRRTIRLGVEFVIHRHRGFPGVQQRLALVEPVLVFHPFARLEREGHRLVLIGTLLRRDERLARRA